MTQTKEQKTATERLRALPGVAERRYRVVPDAEGWPLIPGRLGQIEHHDGTTLAVYTDRSRMVSKLAAIHGVRRHQTGDTEARLLFEPALLPQVAEVIQAKRRRASMTSEQARALGAGTAYSTT